MKKSDYSTGYTGGMKKGKTIPAKSPATDSTKISSGYAKKPSTKKGSLK